MQSFIFGAMIGDIVGSRFEFDNIKSKDFELFHDNCSFTDDSVMTLAISYALIEASKDWSDLSEQAVQAMQKFGQAFENRGYGGRFYDWLYSESPKPYHSFGNGAAMRVSPVAFAAKTLDEVKALSKAVTEVTHNHPEGLKAAEAVAVAIFLLRNKTPIDEVKRYICKQYYTIDFTLDEIRECNTFDETCQISVPQAFEAFFEATSFEDAIRNAISIGGDSDTIAAIAASMAHVAFGIPEYIQDKAQDYLLEPFFLIQKKFYEIFLT